MDIYTQHFVILTAAEQDALKSALGRSFCRLRETCDKMCLEMYDTFDWRLHRHDWHLFRSADRLFIVQAASGQVISDMDLAGKKIGRFSWEFPASDFSDRLAPVIEMRALLLMARFERTIDRTAVCNADDKMVAQLEFESLAMAGKKEIVAHGRLLPVKGYEEESRCISAIIRELNLAPAKVSAAVDRLHKAGIHPGAYTSKFNTALDAQMPAGQAVHLILRHQAAVIRQNLEGVRKDIDTEFLHDLRVAVRRARSLLGQTKGVLGEAATAALQADLKTIGAVTGQVRDLDVYLLKKKAYTQKVPEILRPGIAYMFSGLQRKRRNAMNRMIKAMAQPEFNDALAALAGLRQPKPGAGGDDLGTAPIGELAKSVIYKRFQRIIKKGGRISADTQDEKLHRLRIDCKKLRYLLEFFSSLFPDEKVQELIKQLKGLQKNLGDFNDLSVQQRFLSDYLKSIKSQSPHAVMLAAATGALITSLAGDQQRVRSQFLGVFEGFGSKENQARFASLFGRSTS